MNRAALPAWRRPIPKTLMLLVDALAAAYLYHVTGSLLFFLVAALFGAATAGNAFLLLTEPTPAKRS